jgi:hypothetical protein
MKKMHEIENNIENHLKSVSEKMTSASQWLSSSENQ